MSERMLAEVFCPPARRTRAMLVVLAYLPGWKLYARAQRWATDRCVDRYRRQM